MAGPVWIEQAKVLPRVCWLPFWTEGPEIQSGGKLQAVEVYLAGKGSQVEISRKYGLQDRRGRRKKEQTPRTKIKWAQIKIEQLKHKLYLAEMERDLLKNWMR